jgi:hypothetical protein
VEVAVGETPLEELAAPEVVAMAALVQPMGPLALLILVAAVVLHGMVYLPLVAAASSSSATRSNELTL